MRFPVAVACAALAFTVGLTSSVHAGYIVTVAEVGSDVVATGSGSLNVSSLTFSSVGASDRARVFPTFPTFYIGPAALTAYDRYNTIVSPGAYGTGSSSTLADSGSGSIVGILGTSLYVPDGYVSGTDLGTSTATWTNTTLSALGITVGTYAWTWGSGGDADSFTLNVVAPSATVPEPASMALFGTAFAGLGLVRRRRGRKAA